MAAVARLFAVTLDCPEPLDLARFYQSFTGGEVVQSGNSDFVVLSTGGVRMDFQRGANPAARWPDDDPPRRAPLDFHVDDLDPAGGYLGGQGAGPARHPPRPKPFPGVVHSA